MEPRCTRCGRPGTEARVLSTHSTSEGWVRYRRCACGEVSIELITLGAHTTTVDAVASTSGHDGPGTLPARCAVAARV
ncbi:hypothetical protein [Pseudonocardia sp.]|uniref:hypothetical protein n=1 Tax=Pseudonocardia sp. TaxID=60912 RepID=UPI003D14A6B7